MEESYDSRWMILINLLLGDFKEKPNYYLTKMIDFHKLKEIKK